MFNPDADQMPINPLPPVVLLLALAVGVPEVIFQLGEAGFIGGPEAIGWRTQAVRQIGFFDQLFEFMRQTGTLHFDILYRFATFPFVHYSLMHAGFAVVMLLALGKYVGEVFHPVALLGLFLLSSMVASLALGLAFDFQAPLIGAYPAIYGLLGAYTWMLWLTAGATGSSRLQAFRLIGVLMGLQIFFRLAFGGGPDWFSDMVGFLTGFALSFVLAPDGRRRVRRWLDTIRQRG